MVTINFGMSGIRPEDASHVLQRLFAQRFAPWLRRAAANDNKLKPTYAWSLEAPHGTVSAHVLIHLPQELVGSFRVRLAKWLEGLSGSTVPSRALDLRPIYNLVGATRYLLKGINPTWAEHLAIKPVHQGEIIGKRSGFSRNLGPAARRRTGYKPNRHLV
jgi:hypothetical protein